MYCADSRVVRLGTWSPIPIGYDPPTIYDFYVQGVDTPSWGNFPYEHAVWLEQINEEREAAE